MTAADPAVLPLGRIVRPADYVRVLATPMRLRSPHFAVHHLEGRPLPTKPSAARSVELADASRAPVTASLSTELSTGWVPPSGADVEDSSGAVPAGSFVVPARPGGVQRWLGLVVPKRHAKRAVTRTLVKRQIRNVAAACAPQLEPGLWVVRQRSPFDPAHYASAASDALKEAARAELRALFERAVRGERDRVKPRGAAPTSAKAGKGRRGRRADPAAPLPPATPEGAPCAA